MPEDVKTPELEVIKTSSENILELKTCDHNPTSEMIEDLYQRKDEVESVAAYIHMKDGRAYVLHSVEGPQEFAYAAMIMQESFSNYIEETREEVEF